jgi:hypothetical protein
VAFWILICLGSGLALLWLLRITRVSLGLPVAYLFSLLLIHVPGAFAHLISDGFLLNSDLVEMAMRFTAAAVVCFVAGVWLARFRYQRRDAIPIDNREFHWFCVIGGWFLLYGLSFLSRIPSLGAALNQGGGVWMLGALLGMRRAIDRVELTRVAAWLCVLAVYPILMLVIGGFVSYGAAAVIVVLAALTISVRSRWRIAAAFAVVTFLGLSGFVSYFQHRTEIRREVWGGAPMEARIATITDAAKDFQWLDFSNPEHLTALDLRLNQNYFVGLAAQRIDRGIVTYLYGTSFWEGLLALIPRAIWPEKPVFAGSPEIVAKMTGLELDPNTSFGVGNVMEFEINFGWAGVIVGFVLLGWVIGILDLKAADAERRGDYGSAILYFLPCVALIQPNGSLVELFSGSAAALVAGLLWRYIWRAWSYDRAMRKRRLAPFVPNHRASTPDLSEPAS